MSDPACVFGYASLVALPHSLAIDAEEHGPVAGRLRGYRRFWGAAMNNWEGGDGAKHWLDRETGERPRIHVAYLDVEPCDGHVVNGVAIPVDAERLAALDAREINYARIEVTGAFEPGEPLPEAGSSAAPPAPRSRRVFTYIGLDAARERCRQGALDRDIFVSRDYVAAVRRAFERLGPAALAEFDSSTDPLPFPQRDLRVILPA